MMEPEPAFIMGMMAAASIGWVWRWRQRRYERIMEAKLSAAPNGEEWRKQAAMLLEENGTLKALIARNEERLAVLERIATDPAERTAREIENLR